MHTKVTTTLSHISPRQFDDICDASLRDDLIRNYANRLARFTAARLSATQMRNFLELAFGANWYEQPFAKLRATASITKLAKGEAMPYRDRIIQWHKPTNDTLNRASELRDSTYGRLIEKYYGKKFAQSMYKTLKCFDGCGKRQTKNAMITCVKFAMLVCEYAPDYKKQMRTSTYRDLFCNSWAVDCVLQMWSKENRDVMPQDMRAEIFHDFVQYIFESKSGVSEYERVLQNLRERIHGCVWRIATWDGYSRMKNTQKLVTYYREYKRSKEMRGYTQALQLKPVGINCSAYRPNPQLYRMVKQVFNAKVDDDTKRETIHQMSIQIERASKYRRAIFTPHYVIEGSK